MYQIENWRTVLRGRAGRVRGIGVGRNVVLLGLVSLFTDISSEMVATILPLYLVYTLGFTPLQFGVVDGLYQGAAALVRVLGGFAADSWRRHKEVASLGYGLSAVCKLGYLAAGSAWAAIAGLVFLDRTGKGFRTAPRDALISLSTPRPHLAAAFGVHRALDTTGALLGPLAAFVLLFLAPRAFDAIFVVSFAFALIGLMILLLFVENQPVRVEAGEGGPVSLRAAVGLLAAPPFRALTIAGAALGLFTMSDGFLYLGLQQRIDLDPSYFPLLFVGTAGAYMLLAVPAGRLADRVGRGRVFLGGYALLLLAYGLLLLPVTVRPLELVLLLTLLGAYYAATDGVLMAMASVILPPELRGSGMGLLITATSLARLAASIVFGALWTWLGFRPAVVVFAGALVLALALAVVTLGSARIRRAYA